MSDAAAVSLFWGLIVAVGALGGIAFVIGMRSTP